jgi:hypothetical protein
MEKTTMKNSIKTLLIFSSLAYTVNASATEADKASASTSHEADHQMKDMKGSKPEMQGMMDMQGMMEKGNEKMGAMMNNMSNPKMQEQMMKMHEDLGKMMGQMKAMYGMMGGKSDMGSMPEGQMKGMDTPEMKQNSEQKKK